MWKWLLSALGFAPAEKTPPWTELPPGVIVKDCVAVGCTVSPAPKPEPKPGTWHELVERRKALQKMAEEAGQGFGVSSSFKQMVSGNSKTVIRSFLTSDHDIRSENLVLVVERSDEYRRSEIALNYDEALALYRGLVLLFGDRATCAGCAAAEKLLFSGLQVWCPACKAQVVLMGETPRCPHCGGVFTCAHRDVFLQLPDQHSSPSAVPQAPEEKK